MSIFRPNLTAGTTAFVLICFCGVLFAGGVPFNAEHGLVEVTVTIDNRVTGRFGIDTGADGVYLDREFAIENDLVTTTGQPTLRVTGISGASAGRSVTLGSFEFGDERLMNLEATIIDFDSLSPGNAGESPDGLIGYDLLRRMYLTIDYPARQLEASFTRPDFLIRGDLPQVPFKLYNHMIIVEVTLRDGTTQPMILDYGASVTAISPEVAGGIGLDGSSGEIQSAGRMSLDDLIVTDDVMVAVTDLSRYSGAIPGFSVEGILGASFFYAHKITINYRKNEIYLHG